MKLLAPSWGWRLFASGSWSALMALNQFHPFEIPVSLCSETVVFPPCEAVGCCARDPWDVSLGALPALRWPTHIPLCGSTERECQCCPQTQIYFFKAECHWAAGLDMVGPNGYGGVCSFHINAQFEEGCVSAPLPLKHLKHWLSLHTLLWVYWVRLGPGGAFNTGAWWDGSDHEGWAKGERQLFWGETRFWIWHQVTNCKWATAGDRVGY